ncbi:hypothetical protein F4802DRAFT_574885 [Xylaria palmicola]|nr:hypothetical protein F4802DRAFT_574885 [Xylaria palmicola]
MCSKVIFLYKCGCAERVLFECPFSSTQQYPNCSKRYRRHQQSLLAPNSLAKPTTAPSPQQSPPDSSQIEVPTSPPSGHTSPRTTQTEARQARETRTTDVDDVCHDCWQSNLRLDNPTDHDDIVSPNTMGDDEGQAGNLATSRILREISLNELMLPPPNLNTGPVSSAEHLSEN